MTRLGNNKKRDQVSPTRLATALRELADLVDDGEYTTGDGLFDLSSFGVHLEGALDVGFVEKDGLKAIGGAA